MSLIWKLKIDMNSKTIYKIIPKTTFLEHFISIDIYSAPYIICVRYSAEKWTLGGKTQTFLSSN